VRAIRGATAPDAASREQMIDRVTGLLAEIFERNQVALDDVISILFTATDDLHCMFPAEAARTMGLGDIPLMCARELDITGGMPRVVRVMVTVESALERNAVDHVYHGATQALRPDISARTNSSTVDS
jgi:chorismate mutase